MCPVPSFPSAIVTFRNLVDGRKTYDKEEFLKVIKNIICFEEGLLNQSFLRTPLNREEEELYSSLTENATSLAELLKTIRDWSDLRNRHQAVGKLLTRQEELFLTIRERKAALEEELPLENTRDFLIGAFLFLRLGGDPKSMIEASPALFSTCIALEDRYGREKEHFNKTATEQFEKGFSLLREGCSVLAPIFQKSEVEIESESEEQRILIEKGCALLKAGSQIVRFFQDWLKKEDIRKQSFSRFNIPVAGPFFHDLLRALEQGRDWHELQPDALRVMKEHLMPFWEKSRDHLFIRPSQSKALISEITKTLQKLQISLLNANLDTASLEVSLEDLSSLFTDLDRTALAALESKDPLQTEAVELIRNVSLGCSPDHLLCSFLEKLQESWPDRYKEARISWLSYLEEGKPLLLTGLEEFLDDVPSALSYPCQSCGRDQKPGRVRCICCGEPLTYIGTVSTVQASSDILSEKDLAFPGAAEPLVRFFLSWHKTGLFQKSEAEAALSFYQSTLEQTRLGLATQASSDDLACSLEGLEKFTELGRKIAQQLECEDMEGLRKSLIAAAQTARAYSPPGSMKDHYIDLPVAEDEDITVNFLFED